MLLLKQNNIYSSDTTKVIKKNIIYVMPTSIVGDLWDLSNTWLEVGYNRSLKSNQSIGLRLGVIVYSQKTTQDLLSDIDSEKSSGFNLNAEHKIILIKKFYYSTNVSFQQTKTFRKEELNEGTPEFTINDYYVNRMVYAFIPKIGFLFINKYNLFTDVGLGVGVRYIQSKSFNKIDKTANLGREFLNDKVFDDGDKLIPRIVLQIKIGFNF